MRLPEAKRGHLLVHLIKHEKDQVQDLRERKWETFLLEVTTFCEANFVPIVNMKNIIDSRTRMKRDETTVANYHHYRYEIYNEVLVSIVAKMNERFSEISTDLLLSVACLDPRDSFSNFYVEKLVHLAELYTEDFSWNEVIMIQSQLEMYIYDIRKDVNFNAIEDLGSFAKKMLTTTKAQSFSLVYRLIELALLLPIATTSVERVFSQMNIVKIDL